MKARSPLAERFFARGRVDDCPIYDMHAHMGPFYGINMPRADVDSMVRATEKPNVKMQVFCHHATLLSPDVGNHVNIEAVRKYPDKLRAYCGINPNYPEIAERDIGGFGEYRDVYVGLKFLADYHCIALTDDRYRSAWELANDRGLLVLLHTWGGSAYNGEAPVRACAEKYPNAKILMGHSIHGHWDEAISLVNDLPNTYMELCAVIDERGVLEKLVEGAGSDRIVFGTDYPWFDYHYYIGAVLGSEIGDEDCRNIFYRNAEKLLAG